LGRTFRTIFDFHCRKNATSMFGCYICQKVATLMCQKFRLNFVKQNDSMISFLSAIVYLFDALISEYIETLNCLNFSKKTGKMGVF